MFVKNRSSNYNQHLVSTTHKVIEVNFTTAQHSGNTGFQFIKVLTQTLHFNVRWMLSTVDVINSILGF